MGHTRMLLDALRASQPLIDRFFVHNTSRKTISVTPCMSDALWLREDQSVNSCSLCALLDQDA